LKLSIDDPAYAKKTGSECKKWAKVVPDGVDEVQNGTGMGFSFHNTAGMHLSSNLPCTSKKHLTAHH
jgi:hypothetical protein